MESTVTRKFFKGLMITSGITLALSGSVLATDYYENDVTPPWGRVSIVGATEVNNVNYVDRQTVEVQIYASDDMCKDSEIKYYISTSEISDTTKLADSNWLPYAEGGVKTSITLPNVSGLNKIYAVFKDHNGNTSLVYSGSDLEQTVTYNANASDATMPTGMASKRMHGAPFVITTQSPEREGYYFKGWGLSASDTTPTFYAGDVIPADMSIGTGNTATLYAIWTTELSGLPKLSDVVKVGDYVNYPVYYDNVATSSSSYISTYKGWRVISKDVDIDGNESIGTVNLVSAGVPMTFYHASSVSNSITKLAINFLTTPFHTSDNETYRKTGFDPNKTLTEIFNNKYTAVYANDTSVTYPTYSTNTVTATKTANTLKVRAMTKEDVYNATASSDRPITSIGSGGLSNASYQNLFKIDAYYWLASAYNRYDLWSVDNDGSVYDGRNDDSEYGVRPVVSLRSEVLATGTDMIGAWNIEL